MAIDLYYMPSSAPCRAIILLSKQLGIELNLKFLNLLAKEQLTPEFIKLNPQHTIPTLDDNGFCLWESRAILGYLANQYGKDDSLYPAEPKARGIVDQRLYFDLDVLYRRFQDLYYPHFFMNAPLAEDKVVKVNEALQWLDDYLKQTKWVAGEQLTIADYPLMASVTTFEVAGHDLKPYSNIARWLSECKTTMPGYAESYEDVRNFFAKVVENKKLNQ